MLSASGHKIHGPKGAGFLICGQPCEDKADHFRRRSAEKICAPERKTYRESQDLDIGVKNDLSGS